jgi:molybdopterin-containing oxidoreductase family membrane subunit
MAVTEPRTAAPTFADVNRDVGATLRTPGPLYFAWMCVIGLLLAAFLAAWTYQIYIGMGAAGKRAPQMWAMYITTFVFWIGIGHAGTLISAVLYLFRARWRTSIYRAAEAMTIFAVMTAGLFPLIHAGRMWYAYFLLPYPNQRYLWPNFRSPLVWDVFAISTYLSVSTIFFIVGLIPDIAALRDSSTGWRRRVYGMLSLGWEGSDEQWRPYRRAYGLFAALATPLVLSVHSVVSWDFAMALVPGWHSTLFAPFFVDGAIFSGFAMVVVLVLPMRYFFGLHAYVTDRHLDAMAKLILTTGLVLTYFYVCEIFIAWYSGDHFERASLFWKVTKSYAWAMWTMYFCNCVSPLIFFWKRARTSVPILYTVSILVLIGMWFERFNIIVPSLAHDFYPYTWGIYVPSATDSMIVIGSFAFFFLLFVGFIRVMPSLSIVEVKETLPPPMKEHHGRHH